MSLYAVISIIKKGVFTKKFISLILSVVLLTIPLCNEVFAQQSLNTTNNLNSQEVVLLTDEDDIREYLESKGEKYDPNLIEIIKIIYNTGIDEKTGVDSRILGLDYVVRNTNVYMYTDTSNLLAQFNFPAGKVEISETYTVENKFSADAGVTKGMLKIALGYSVTSSHSISATWSNTYNNRVKIKIYPLYQVTKGELWEDDVWKDDCLGNFKAYNIKGTDVRVYNA